VNRYAVLRQRFVDAELAKRVPRIPWQVDAEPGFGRCRVAFHDNKRDASLV
jgi:hypothetical protein